MKLRILCVALWSILSIPSSYAVKFNLCDLVGIVLLPSGEHVDYYTFRKVKSNLVRLAKSYPEAFTDAAFLAHDPQFKIQNREVLNILVAVDFIKVLGGMDYITRSILLAATYIDGSKVKFRSPESWANQGIKIAEVTQEPHLILDIDIPKLSLYFKSIDKISTYITKVLADHGLQSMPGQNLVIDAHHNQIRFNGGIAIEFRKGIPFLIYTPLGGVLAMGMAMGTLRNPEEAKDKVIKKLGLVEIVPKQATPDGEFGPVYQVTKDMDGKNLPPVQFVKREQILDDDELNEIWKLMLPIRDVR